MTEPARPRPRAGAAVAARQGGCLARPNLRHRTVSRQRDNVDPCDHTASRAACHRPSAPMTLAPGPNPRRSAAPHAAGSRRSSATRTARTPS
jgi:hypothetical protein